MPESASGGGVPKEIKKEKIKKNLGGLNHIRRTRHPPGPDPTPAPPPDHTPRPVDRHTPVKILPWPQLRCGR